MFAYYLNLWNGIEQWLTNEDGQDLVEYALLLVLIALFVIGAVELLGGGVQTVMQNAAAALGAAVE